MHGVLDFINGTLTGSESLVGRDSGGHIPAITRRKFDTGINQEQVPRLYLVAMIMVVQRLAVHRSNRCKRKVTVVGLGHTVHFRHHFIFVHTRPNHFHRLDMHVGSHITCFFYLNNFFRRLIIALCHHRTDKRDGSFLARSGNTQPVHQLQLVLGTVRRKIVYSLAFLHSFVQVTGYIGRRAGLRNAHPLALLFQSGLGTHPDNMVDGQFITEDNLLILINVDNGRQTGK